MNIETLETSETKQQRNNGERLKERIETINRKKISDITYDLSKLNKKYKDAARYIYLYIYIYILIHS